MLAATARLLLVIPLILLAVLVLGTSAVPGLWLFNELQSLSLDLPQLTRTVITAVALPLCFYVSGLTMLFVAPLFNFLLRGYPRPYRGPAVSPGALRWYVHGAIIFTVRYTFLELITPSEFSVLYFRLMGMKIGRNVTINTTAINEASMIELGDNATIGGSASVMGHYSQGGYLIIAPVKIGRRATIGLRAIVMGGVEVGENAKVLANSFVLPNTKIPAGETWAGIPAVKITLQKSE